MLIVLQFKDDILDLLAAGTLMIASRQGEPPNMPSTDADLEAITGLQVQASLERSNHLILFQIIRKCMHSTPTVTFPGGQAGPMKATNTANGISAG